MFDRESGFLLHFADDSINNRFMLFHMTAGEDDSVSTFTDFFLYKHFCAVLDHTQIGEDDFFCVFHFDSDPFYRLDFL